MGSVRRRLERLEAFASGPAIDEGSEARQVIEDLLNEHAIARGELDPADVPNLEESRRRADEACGELVDEWKRLGIWGA